jgi:hypothetical protein
MKMKLKFEGHKANGYGASQEQSSLMPAVELGCFRDLMPTTIQATYSAFRLQEFEPKCKGRIHYISLLNG